MKEEENIDHLFREGVQSEFPFDEKLWSQVEKDLPKADERKFGWLYYLNGILILGIHFFVIGFNDPFIPENPAVNTSKIQSDYPSESNNLIAENLNSAEESNQPEIHQKTGIAVNRTTTIEANQNNLKQETSKPENIGFPEENTEERKASQFPDESSTTSKDIKRENQDLSDEYYSERTGDGFKRDQENPLVEVAEEEAKHQSVLNVLDKLNLLGFRINQSDMDPSPLFETNTVADLPKNKSYFIELQYRQSLSIDKEISSLSPNLEGLRKESEKLKSANQFGFLILNNWGKFEFGVGARYFELVERVNYNINDVEVTNTDINDTTYVLLDQNFSQNGNNVWLIEERINSYTLVDKTNFSKNYTYENSFEFIQIPATIGYNYNWKRYVLGLRAGLSMNFLISSEGGYIDEDGRRINSFENSDPLNTFSLSSEASFRIGYGLNEFISLGTDLNYQTNLNSMTNDYKTNLRGSYIGLWIYFKAL